jgi:hypothetical protein
MGERSCESLQLERMRQEYEPRGSLIMGYDWEGLFQRERSGPGDRLE